MKFKLKDNYINATVIKVNETFLLTTEMSQLELEHIYKMVGSEYVEIVDEEEETILESLAKITKKKSLKKHTLDDNNPEISE